MSLEQRLLLGLDEAGRGCVMGPLCMAGVVVPANNGRERLLSMGCTDSKKFGAGIAARKQRKKLAETISNEFQTHIEVVDAGIIDSYVLKSSLNIAEQDTARKILSLLRFHQATLDGKKIFSPISREDARVKVFDKADVDYPEVAAASILAKNARDEALAKIYADLGFPETLPGGGYPNIATHRLLINYFQNHGALPPEYRKSYQWKLLADSIASTN